LTLTIIQRMTCTMNNNLNLRLSLKALPDGGAAVVV
jgi:hypothetical protein